MKDALLAAASENTYDVGPIAVLHDWLLENGDPDTVRAVEAADLLPPVERVEDLKGQILGVAKALRGEKDDDDKVVLVTMRGEVCILYHSQDCCESVTLEDVCGELDWLVGTPLTVAEEVNSDGRPAEDRGDESYTWTFYRFATARGWVTLRWYGCSNGHYSEAVDFVVKRPAGPAGRMPQV